MYYIYNIGKTPSQYQYNMFGLKTINYHVSLYNGHITLPRVNIIIYINYNVSISFRRYQIVITCWSREFFIGFQMILYYNIGICKLVTVKSHHHRAVVTRNLSIKFKMLNKLKNRRSTG